MRAMDIFSRDDNQFISWNEKQKYIDKSKEGDSITSNNNESNQLQTDEDYIYVKIQIYQLTF